MVCCVGLVYGRLFLELRFCVKLITCVGLLGFGLVALAYVSVLRVACCLLLFWVLSLFVVFYCDGCVLWVSLLLGFRSCFMGSSCLLSTLDYLGVVFLCLMCLIGYLV